MTKSCFLKLSISLVLALGVNQVSASEIVVGIENIRATHGRLRISVCMNADEFYERRCTAARSIKTVAPISKAKFENMPATPVAVLVHHDLNNNGMLDTNLFGIPVEPVGFSNNPTMAYGPPPFEECLVSTAAPKNTIRITLNNE